MRKVLKVILVLLMMVTLNVIHVDASNSSIVLKANTNKVQIGKTFTVNINITCDTRFEGLTGELTYDKTKLELVKYENAAGMADLNAEDAKGKYIVTVFPNSANTVKSGTCQTLTFKVLNGVHNNEVLEILLTANMKDGDEKLGKSVAQTIVTVGEDITVTSSEYTLNKEENYIAGINPNTTVSVLKNKITTNATQIRVLQGEKELSSSDIIGTGALIVLKNNYDEQAFLLLVKGDVDGNGDADFWDMLAINKHRLGISELEDLVQIAGDVTGDGETNFWDMLEINKYRLGLKATL